MKRFRLFIVFTAIIVLLNCADIIAKPKDIPKETPAQSVKPSQPPAETPSGTQPATPAQPAVPGEQPSTPATPAEPGKPEHPVKPEHPEEPVKPTKPEQKPKVPEKPTEPTNPSQPSQPSVPSGSGIPIPPVPPAPPAAGGAAVVPVVTPPVPPVPPTPPVSAPVSGAGKVLKGAEKIGVGIISTIIPKKKEKTKKEPPPALQKSTTVQIETKPKIEKSTDTKNGTNVPFQPVVIPLFSEGSGPKIAVFDFEGEHGVEIADYISEALTKNFRVYDRKSLSGKGLAKEKVNNATLKKIKKDVDADYFVTGGVSKKTETLYIVSVFLKDGKKGDTKMTDYPKFKKLDELKSTAEIIAGKIKKRVGELK